MHTTRGPRFSYDDEVHSLAEEQHGLITTAQLARIGSASALHRRRRAGALVRLQPNVYVVPRLIEDRSHLAAAVLRCPDAVASHRSAATLWGLDGLEEEVVEVTVPRHVRLPGRWVHRSADLAPFEVTEVDGIRCTDPTRTLCDLGAVVSADVLDRAVESALRRRITSVSRLRWRLDQLARPGRPGSRPLRRVLDRRPDGAAPTESDSRPSSSRASGPPACPSRPASIPSGCPTGPRSASTWPGPNRGWRSSSTGGRATAPRWRSTGIAGARAGSSGRGGPCSASPGRTSSRTAPRRRALPRGGDRGAPGGDDEGRVKKGPFP